MWNYGKGLSIAAKKILIYLLSIILAMLLFYIAYTFILPHSQDPNDPANIENYIGTMAVILTIVGYMLKVTDALVSRQVETNLMLSADITIENNYAIITCIVENKSIKRIKNIKCFLFIDQPILERNSGIFKANYILKHDCENKLICQLAKECKNSNIDSYPSRFEIKRNEVNLYYGFKKLEFLSSESVLCINSGERFSEDVVFNLKPGVYRVLIIGLYGQGLNHCSCANKQFIIHNTAYSAP